MRITMVTPYDPRPPRVQGRQAAVGGVERVFAEVSRRLVRRGHEVTLVTSAEEAGQRWDRGVLTILHPRRFTVLRAPSAKLAGGVHPDAQVVHVAGTYPFTTAPVIRRARRLGIPTVLDFHFEPRPSSLVGRVGAQAYRWSARRTFAAADLVVVRSQAYARASPSLRDVDPGRLRVVPNGVDTVRFQLQGPRTAGPYLLAVGRLVPYKGIDLLLSALALVRPHMPLLVVGDGPERARLERRARRLGVNVRFLGHVPDASLPALYRGAALTVLPSVNGQEAFGIALVESMACGTPVVASRLPGVEEVARIGGVLAEPGDPASLARALQAALASNRLPRGPVLARRVQKEFSWDAVTDRLVAVYREAMRGALGASPRPAQEVLVRANPRRDAVL